ncbi:MAG: polyhydroxyalkanoate depolymerase, partial [Alphaproteobacteria bacterium]|nr:polyhydroxyalkanoate depolymerase [Alphaproteobacteria bacterium]
MQYQAYEFAQAWMSPVRAATQGLKLTLNSPFNLMGNTLWGRQTAAACDLFEGLTRRYGKPEFGIAETLIGDELASVGEEIVLSKDFGALKHLTRETSKPRNDPKVLIIAPMSGHYATLLRDTVRTMLPEHDVFITDWCDARDVPLSRGAFGLDDYTDYLIEFLRFLGPDTHVIAVCQPAVSALVATAVLAMAGDSCQPKS